MAAVDRGWLDVAWMPRIASAPASEPGFQGVSERSVGASNAEAGVLGLQWASNGDEHDRRARKRKQARKGSAWASA